MGNKEFFDNFDNKIEIDWNKITTEKLDKMFKQLSEQEATEVFNQMQAAIDTNNKRKTMIKWSFIALQLAIKYGLKVV